MLIIFLQELIQGYFNTVGQSHLNYYYQQFKYQNKTTSDRSTHKD
jgi:hypothetical protein